MRTNGIYHIALCMLFILTSAMSCEEDSGEGFTVIAGIELTHFDNAGEHPIENDRCPKEAYLLRIAPRCENYYGITTLRSPVIAFRIITLTDFDESHPAGSDIYRLFKDYPAKLLGDDLREGSLGDDPLQEGMPITTLEPGAFYKALLTAPQPGTYQFRIELEMEDGSVVSADTLPVNLY